MSFLIRVIIPDIPGSLGRLAEAFGEVGANIKSVDIVENSSPSEAVNDMVVTLPPGVLADTLITAANNVDGVEVDSIRPFSGRVDRRGQIEMLKQVARHSSNLPQALAHLMTVLPAALTASWCLVLARSDDGWHRVAASVAAPEDDLSTVRDLDVSSPRMVTTESDPWVPESWTVLDSSLAAAPLMGTDMLMVVARVGGPDFLPGEVDHVGNLGEILGALLRRSSRK